jgi:hypothetical protein
MDFEVQVQPQTSPVSATGFEVQVQVQVQSDLDFEVHKSNPKSDSARHSQKADFAHNDLYVLQLQLNPQAQRLVVTIVFGTTFVTKRSQLLEIIVVLGVTAVTIFGTAVGIATIAAVGIAGSALGRSSATPSPSPAPFE